MSLRRIANGFQQRGISARIVLETRDCRAVLGVAACWVGGMQIFVKTFTSKSGIQDGMRHRGEFLELCSFCNLTCFSIKSVEDVEL